jgi:competence protein ComFC
VIEQQHVLSSEFLGYDAAGHPQFHTVRSEFGELVYRMKYRSDRIALEHVAGTAVAFLQRWKLEPDAVVPVPPSRRRAFQPVLELARVMGAAIGKPFLPGAVAKVAETPALKDVLDAEERRKLLAGAFRVDRDVIAGRRLLLIDDLYQSGATSAIVAQELSDGGAAEVCFLAMTRTRTRP